MFDRVIRTLTFSAETDGYFAPNLPTPALWTDIRRLWSDLGSASADDELVTVSRRKEVH